MYLASKKSVNDAGRIAENLPAKFCSLKHWLKILVKILAIGGE